VAGKHEAACVAQLDNYSGPEVTKTFFRATDLLVTSLVTPFASLASPALRS